MKKNFHFTFILLAVLFFTVTLTETAFAEDPQPSGFHEGKKQDSQRREAMKKVLIHRFLKKEMPEFLEKVQAAEKEYPEAVMEFKKDMRQGEKERLFHGHVKGKMDPETQEIMQKFLEIELESYVIAQKYKESTDEKEKQELKAALQGVLNKSFDIKADLQKRIIKKMEKRILNLKDLLENRRAIKDQIIKERFELITDNSELTRW